jgi:hypothetical protein
LWQRGWSAKQEIKKAPDLMDRGRGQRIPVEISEL